MPRDKQVGELEEFQILERELNYLADFFGSLDNLISVFGNSITFFLGNKLYRFDTVALKSCSQTLKSIKYCCSIGSFGDANTLVRKLRDDLIQFAYFLVIINKREPFLDDSFNDKKTNDEEALEKWIMNTIHYSECPILRKKLDIKNYMDVIGDYNRVKHILKEYNLTTMWKELSYHLNNYVHNNGISYSKRNCINGYDSKAIEYLNEVKKNVSYVSSVFVILVLLIESKLFGSTDYIDYCECGLEPVEDSQYFIAPFVQEFIDNTIKVLHPELLEFLKGSNSNGMFID